MFSTKRLIPVNFDGFNYARADDDVLLGFGAV
jgi:hypothetical protein